MEDNNMKRGLNSETYIHDSNRWRYRYWTFVATGSVISQAGPGGAILAYILIGIMLYFLMSSIGELATFYPVSGSLVHTLPDLLIRHLVLQWVGCIGVCGHL